MELKKIINEFENTTGYKLEIRDNKLFYDGDIDLRNTPIKELPDNMTVGGDLLLDGTNITMLPKKLTVGKCLSLAHTTIKELPQNLTVGGCLDLEYTPITEWKKNKGVTVGGIIYLTIVRKI